MQAYVTSDVGMTREINEDYFSVSYPGDEVQLFIIADGMGGYNGGVVASKLAVQSVRNYILSNYEETDKSRESLLKLVKASVQYANMIVHDKAISTTDTKQMGTTLDVCLINQGKLYIGHVGDSRIYRIRKEYMRKLTKDHSYVQQLLDEGKITKEQSATHPDRNMLMKALGVTGYIEPDAMVKGYLKDDIILMCTDGLTNMVSEEEIYKIIKENPTDASKPLIQKANDNGGRDNITAIIIR